MACFIEFAATLRRQALQTPSEAEKQLYLAVVQGSVRARLNGVILGPTWLKQQRSSGNGATAFPPDIELSVDDVRRIWG
jgi:hypothetical protein